MTATAFPAAVNGVLLPDILGDCWDTLANCPGATLFARYRQSDLDGGLLWLNGERTARDVKLLWWLTAGNTLTDLWICKHCGHEDQFTREGYEAPRTRAMDLAYSNSDEDLLYRLHEYAAITPPGIGRNVHKDVQTYATQGGYRTVANFCHQRSLGNDRSGWEGSEVAEPETDVYEIVPVTQAWADKWLQTNREAAEKSYRGALHRLENPMARKMGVDTLQLAMSTHAYRMAHYFGFIAD